MSDAADVVILSSVCEFKVTRWRIKFKKSVS